MLHIKNHCFDILYFQNAAKVDRVHVKWTKPIPAHDSTMSSMSRDMDELSNFGNVEYVSLYNFQV